MSDLPAGWVETTIGDVVEPKVEQRTPLEDEHFYYIDISSIDRTSKKIVDPQKLSGKDAPSRARQVVASGDVLVSMTRPNLNAVAMVSDDLDKQIASTGFDVLRAKGVDSRWLYYLVRTNDFVTAMSDLVQGALYPAVRPRDIRNFQIPLAPLDEQKRIAEKLDSLLTRVDSCEFHLERVPQILKRFRQSVLAAATSGRLTEEWREENAVNGEWENTDVQSVAFVGTGSTPLRSNSSFYSSKGTPWVTSAATGQPFIHEAKEFVTKEAIKEHRLKLYPIGTVLVAMYGEGKTRGQVSELAIEATINQACAAIIVDETKVAKKYLKLALQANYLEMRELAEGGNQPNLNLSKIKEFTFPLPSPEEQAEIVRRVESLFAVAERLEARYLSASERVARLTPSLLAKGFRGEL